MKKAILEIQDELNARFTNLPKFLNTSLSNRLSYFVPNYRFMPAFKHGMWDGKVRLYSQTGKTYVNLVDDVLDLLYDEGYDLEVIDHRKEYDFSMVKKVTEDVFSHKTWEGTEDGTPIVLRDYQVKAVNSAIEECTGLLELSTGAGKSLPNDTPVHTPTGPKPMGDIKVGDLVCTIGGDTTIVTGVFPQGVLDTYEVLFEDGRSVKCSLDHLWYVSSNTYDYNPMTVEEIMQSDKDLYIPLSIVEYDHKECDKLEDYLYASYEQRLEVLKELMRDGVGDYKDGHFTYTNTNKDLVEFVCKLVYSMGGKGDYVTKRSYHRLDFVIGLSPYELLGKHKFSIKSYKNKNHCLKIVSINKLKSPTEMTCLAVDHESKTYVVGDSIVTHNTLICAALSNAYQSVGNVVLMVPNIDLAIQTQALFKKVGLPAGLWYGELKEKNTITVTTWQSLQNAPELFDGVIAVIVDECHQAKAKVIGEILSGPARNVPIRIGCTGTIPKEVVWQQQIKGILGGSIFQLKAWKLQKEEVLASAEIIQIWLEDSKNPDYPHEFENWSSETEWLINGNKQRIDVITDIINDLVQEEGNTLCLMPYKKHVRSFSENMEGSYVVDGDVSGKNRGAFYKEFGEKDNGTMFATFGVASTGIDIPRIFAMGIFEPGTKFEKVIQTIGRGLRKAKDKEHVVILDIVSDSGLSARHAAKRRLLYKEAHIKCTIEKVNYYKESL